MSAPAGRIQPVRNPVLPIKTTPEIRYWRGFKNPLLVKENNAVTHIHFNPSSPHDFVVTSSTMLQIFSSKTRKISKTISRFKETVYSGEFRADGRLVVAGDATGLVQAFDSNSRSVLVTIKSTKYPVHVTKFHPTELSTLLTASDDRVVRLYDLTSSTPLNEFKAHGDYTRASCFVKGTNLVATGCYDGLVRLYDSRTNEGPAMSFKQDAAVEDIVSLNSTTLVSAGGPMVKVWDLAAGHKLREVSNFQKTVSCLYDGGERGLLAGSLDGHVKIFDSASPTWEVKFGWKFGGAVLSTAVSPNQKHFVTGLASGLLSIRTRKTEPKVKQGVKQEKSGNYARMIRGADYHGEYEHIVISDKAQKKKKLNTFEKHINAFRWSDALDAAFVPGVSTEQTISVLEELRRRGKVLTSLQARDEQSLEPILKWASKSIQDTRCVSIIADWIGSIVDLYGGMIDQSPVLESLVSNLATRIKQEVSKAKEAERIEGMLELLLR